MKVAHLPLNNVSYSDIKILLGQDVKELTENVAATKAKSDAKLHAAYKKCMLGWSMSRPNLPSDQQAMMYSCIVNDENGVGIVMAQEFRNFNALEGLGDKLDKCRKILHASAKNGGLNLMTSIPGVLLLFS
uniref:Uncharacterized protein n=1 Tax=Trichuris muris TaxID=70415 RepID=A0A5S6QM75_TRIMR